MTLKWVRLDLKIYCSGRKPIKLTGLCYITNRTLLNNKFTATKEKQDKVLKFLGKIM